MGIDQELAVGFDGSFDGLLTVVFRRYYDKLNPAYIAEGCIYPEMMYEFVYVDTDMEKARRVWAALKKKSPSSANNVYSAFLYAPDKKYEDKYLDILKYIELVFAEGAKADRYETLDYVLNVHKMVKRVNGEAHSYLGFMRFSETKTGVLYGEFAPVNNVLTIVAQHFKSRLIDEKWVIEDKTYNQAAIYDRVNVIIIDIGTEYIANPEWVPEEEQYRALWQQFIQTIAIEDRISAKRQNQHLPKRYRKHITEWRVSKTTPFC